MFRCSNYYEQSRQLPAENGFQIATLQFTDAVTFAREISKVGTLAGSVASAARLFFVFNPAVPLTVTAVLGVIWGGTHLAANRLEPSAKEMIQYFQDMKDGKYNVNN